MTDYPAFLAGKRLVVPSVGREVAAEDLPAALFPFQRDLVRWSLRKGRAALFADTGLGKTPMQLAWAQHAGDRALILAPLAVAQQTVREGEKFGVPVRYAREQADAAEHGITITNYEMLPHFEPAVFDAVVLDESSILKNFEGKTRSALIAAFRDTPFKLCCTATPAPNDISELANHAEFLGILSRAELLATFFVHDEDGWRLKGHARQPFYRWLASWSMSLRRPSDLGYSDDGYVLPGLAIEPVYVPTEYVPEGQLFAGKLHGITDRVAVRRQTLVERVAAAVKLVAAEPDEPWLAWVGLNEEGQELARQVPGSVLIEGPQTPDEKAAALEAFCDSRARVVVTKVSIAGFGLNLQHCARMVFVGLGDSYEQYYQAIRRCWRFGQQRPVRVFIVLSEPEDAVYQNVLRKEQEARALGDELVEHVRAFEQAEIGLARQQEVYAPLVPLQVPDWLGVA